MRTVAVYALLLVLALGGAYWSMTHEPTETTDEDVTVLDLDRDDLKEVRYVSDELQVTLTPRSDERGDYVWARTVRTPKSDATPEKDEKKDAPEKTETPEDAAPAAEGGADADPHAAEPESAESVPGESKDDSDKDAKEQAAAAEEPAKDDVAEDARANSKDSAVGEPEETKASPSTDTKSAFTPPSPEQEPEVQEFKAAEAAEQMFERWAPFVATRELTGVEESGLDELGLADPEATLTLVLNDGGEEVFDLGGTVFGGASRYVRHRETGRIYLVDSGPMRSLGNADRTLLDRELFRVKQTDMAGLELSSQGKSRAFRQQNPDDMREAYWSVAGEDSKSETADAWIKKLTRVRVRSYPGDDETPSNLASVFEVVVEDDLGKRTKVEVLKGRDGEGNEAWFARSEHNRGLVQIHSAQASDAAADVPTVLDPDAKSLPADEPTDPRQPVNGPPVDSPQPTAPGPMMGPPPGAHGPPGSGHGAPPPMSPAGPPPPPAAPKPSDGAAGSIPANRPMPPPPADQSKSGAEASVTPPAD